MNSILAAFYAPVGEHLLPLLTTFVKQEHNSIKDYLESLVDTIFIALKIKKFDSIPNACRNLLIAMYVAKEDDNSLRLYVVNQLTHHFLENQAWDPS